MSFVMILLTALGLSLDAVAVSASSGMCLPAPRRLSALKMAAWFGAFQALMPAVGYFLGVACSEWLLWTTGSHSGSSRSSEAR
jgi:putative Mn2+ efflux pump MntP